MTTAIEQAKREMYDHLESLKNSVAKIGGNPALYVARVEDFLEVYLEQLRQQYEEMASTAHQRFESIQSLEAVNQELITSLENFKGYNSRQADMIGRADDEIADLESRLAKMTESRDMFRNLHQVHTQAAIGRIGQASTSGQTSGDRASCEEPDAKTAMVLLLALVRIQDLIASWAVDGEKAKKVIREIAGTVNNDPALMKAMNLANFAWPPVKYPHSVPCRCGLNFMVAAPDVMTACSCGCVYKGAIRCIVRNMPTEKEKGIAPEPDAYDGLFVKNTSCMHSFWKIGDDQFICAFCGVGK